MIDSHFRVEVISQTLCPQHVIRVAMGQDYSEDFAYDAFGCDKAKDEAKAGEIVVNQLLKGGRGHYGPLEHPQIVLNCGWFPHSTMQQVRTHRVGVSFDVQSFRYTGNRIYELGRDYLQADSGSDFYDHKEFRDRADEVFYYRPVGDYTDRQGKRYSYTLSQRQDDITIALQLAAHYYKRIESGLSEEHARGNIAFDVRQHWVMSANVRSLMHLLDLRWKADAQLECQQLCDLIWPHFQAWCPQIAEWYESNRKGKARLAP